MTQGEGDRLLELRRSVVAAVNELYEHNLITPTGGNLSVRCPDSDHILVTASRIFKGNLGPEHVLEVDSKGKPVTVGAAEAQGALFTGSGTQGPAGSEPFPPGRRIRPSVETGMHLAIYAARPDVGAVVHTHAPLATVWGLFDEPVPALTVDSIKFTEMRVVAFSAPGSRELATQTAEALNRGPAALLRNHGLVTVGKDLREAVNTALALEESLRVSLLARLGGLLGLAGKEPATIPPKAVEFLKKFFIG